MSHRLKLSLAIFALLSANCAKPHPVNSAQAACAVATSRVTALRHQPASHVAFCDDIPETSSPVGYYLTGLRAHCREERGCGSTLMGWFAIRKSDGKVFEYDVAESEVGRPVGS